MAGLIDPIIQDQYGDPAENGEPTALPDAYIVITLGSLEGTTPSTSITMPIRPIKARFQITRLFPIPLLLDLYLKERQWR